MDPLLLFGEESKRLKFRKLLPTDFEDWKPLFYEKEPAEYLGLDTSLSPEKLCEAWFTKSNWRYDNNLGGMNVLVSKDSNELIGQCGLLVQEIEGEKKIEIGYSILPKFWKQGYASEAAQKCRDFAFENNLTTDLISVIHHQNIGSAKVAQNNGMSILKKDFMYLEMQVNIYGMEKSDWLVNQKI
jgi:RimJ/RimL family protein N-acetyltransferase